MPGIFNNIFFTPNKDVVSTLQNTTTLIFTVVVM